MHPSARALLSAAPAVPADDRTADTHGGFTDANNRFANANDGGSDDGSGDHGSGDDRGCDDGAADANDRLGSDDGSDTDDRPASDDLPCVRLARLQQPVTQGQRQACPNGQTDEFAFGEHRKSPRKNAMVYGLEASESRPTDVP
jgi:hypothetical protein